MSVSRCPGCRSYVKDPFFDPAELSEVYRHYALHETHYAPTPGEIEALEAKVIRIERHAPGRGTLLELGCGRGYLLREAMKRGWRARGLELEGSASDHLLPELAGNIMFVPADSGFSRIETEAYDVICSYQVFEHVLDPVSSFLHCARGLKSGGLFIVDTPNAGSLGARVHGPAWIQHTRPEHFVLFTELALRRLCRANGLDVIQASFGGPPALCSGSAAAGARARRIFSFRKLSRLARTLVVRFGLGDNIELIARKH